MPLLLKGLKVLQDIRSQLQNPEFCDVTIIATDGEIPVNKTILSMRSQYFRSMFSSNNNFQESKTNTVKMPYTRDVLWKVIIYLCCGGMDCEEMELSPLLDLLDLLNMINLAEEFSVVEGFTKDSIKKGSFPIPDCLKYLDHCSKLGLKSVGETLLSYLGDNFESFCHTAEVGVLSEGMIILLLQEKNEDSSQTIFRFRAFVTWLSVNSMDNDIKEEVLNSLNFEDFTSKELSSDVRKSGLYSIDKIMERMEELNQELSKKLEDQYQEFKKERKEKETSVQGDMMTIRQYVGGYWGYIPSGIRNKYGVL